MTPHILAAAGLLVAAQANAVPACTPAAPACSGTVYLCQPVQAVQCAPAAKPKAKPAASKPSAPSTCRRDPVADLQARTWIPQRDRDEIAALIKAGRPTGELRVSGAGVLDMARDPVLLRAPANYTMGNGKVARGAVDLSLWLEPTFGSYWTAGVTTFAVVGPCWRGMEVTRLVSAQAVAAPTPSFAAIGRVPEPSTSWLVAAGILCAAALSRKRRATRG